MTDDFQRLNWPYIIFATKLYFTRLACSKSLKYNLDYPVQADHDLNMRCYGQPDIRFQYLPFIICAYEGDGLSAQRADVAFFKDKLSVIKSNFSALVYYYALLRSKLAQLVNNGHWTKQQKNL